MSRLRLVFLGAFHAKLDGQPITRFGSAKAQGLLSYLVMTAGQPQSRAVLATMFWPEKSESAASHNLRQAISKLRQLLAYAGPGEETTPPFLLVTRQTIQFNPVSDYDLDVDRFLEALHDGRQEEAAVLYRGDLLAGMIIDSAPFEEWRRQRQEQLHDLARKLIGELTERSLNQEMFEQAQRWARRQLELEPWSEKAHQNLMRALWLAGERGAALAQFEACRQILAVELGVQPQAETQQLAQQIREGQSSQRLSILMEAEPPTQHNLPAPLARLVSRDAELNQINELLAQEGCRLVTITGLGGIGKSQLVLAAARAQIHCGWQEICFVPLSPWTALASSEELADGLLKALETAKPNLQPRGQPATAAILQVWRHRKVLLVLDNCEVIISGAGWLGDVLQAAPGLKILAASRHRLNLQAEWAVPLAPLSVAPVADGQFNLSPAAQLFVERAHQARPQFHVTPQNLPWINRICQLLDGLPLGLELAAARARYSTTRQIAHQLAANASTLSSDELDRPSRHRSLTAVFESSLVHLAPQERMAFLRLAVFNGSFEIEAAQAVASTAQTSIFGLVDRSLLRFDPASQRFFRHPVLYAYALEKLRETPDEERVARQRHAVFYAAFLHQRREVLQGFGQAAALREVEADLENILAAWQWAVDRHRLDLLGQAVDSLHEYHLTRGLHEQGEHLFGRAAESIRGKIQAGAVPMPVDQAMLCALLARKIYYLYARGRLAEVLEAAQEIESLGALCPSTAAVMASRWWSNALNRLGRLEEARVRLEHALALSRQIGDTHGQVEVLRSLVHLAMGQGEYARAWRLFDQVWAMRGRARARDEWLMWRLRGHLASAERNFGQACDSYQRALAYAQEIEDSFAQSLLEERLGETYLEMGELETARELLEKALAGFRSAGAGEYEVLSTFHLSRILALAGQQGQASRLLREALALAQQLGSSRQTERITSALQSLTTSAGDVALQSNDQPLAS